MDRVYFVLPLKYIFLPTKILSLLRWYSFKAEKYMFCDNVNLMGQETWHMSDKQAAKAHNFPLS